jgi:hypothetical protein
MYGSTVSRLPPILPLFRHGISIVAESQYMLACAFVLKEDIYLNPVGTAV